MSKDMWIQAAHTKHQRLQITLERLLRNRDIVAGCIGQPWLEEQARKLEQKFFTIADAHPLYREMTSPTETALVEVAELGEYLDEFKMDPAVAAIAADLRSDKYPSSLFELAMAYRFLKAGAEVKLQPMTPKERVADFSATISGLPFTVEVSVCPKDVFARPAFRAPMIAARAVGSVINGAFPVAVRLTVRALPEGNWEAALMADLKQVCNRLKEQAARSEPIKDTLTRDHWSIEAELVTDATEPVPERDVFDPGKAVERSKWDIVFRSSQAPKTEGEPLANVLGDPRRREVARIFAKLPEDEPDPYVVITKKTEKEARQLRGVPGPRIVMLDVTGVESDVLRLDGEQVLAGLATSMRKTPELACVWLASRRFSTALRHQYHLGYVMNGDSVYQLPATFVDRLVEFVWLRDFLGDRDLPLTSYDNAMRDYWRRMKSDFKPWSPQQKDRETTD